MKYSRVGGTGVRLSVVGFGTAQLRMVPERQAKDTLLCGFEHGVNWVHASPDYGGAEELVAEAIQESGRNDLIMASNCFGGMPNSEVHFERTCRILGKDRLEVYGISCIDDAEIVGDNVWGKGGVVEYLLEKKREGRIGALFCSTHAPPDYVARLIESGVFDAIMLAYNPLGFHVLSYYAKSEGKDYEDLAENRRRIFPLAAQLNVGLLLMKPLAGGLLCASKAFPPRKRFTNEPTALLPADVLRTTLMLPGVTAVVPGTASMAEALENASAGHEPFELSAPAHDAFDNVVAQMRSELCTRCGDCESTCSKSLPISWMFREAYVWSYPGDTFDAIDRHHYFEKHPSQTLACVACTDRSCECPHGIEIPTALAEAHSQVLSLSDRGLMHSRPAGREHMVFSGHVQGKIICHEIPNPMQTGQDGTCRIWLENSGDRWWSTAITDSNHDAILMRATAEGLGQIDIRLRHDVHPSERVHFAFDVPAQGKEGSYPLTLDLVSPGESPRETRVLEASLEIVRSLEDQLRSAECYGVEYINCSVPERTPPGARRGIRLELENTGTMTWRATTPLGNSVDVGMFCDSDLIATLKMPREEVHPGERVTIHHLVDMPTVPGHHVFKFELVEQKIALFTDYGVPPLEVEFFVDAESEDHNIELWKTAMEINPWHYHPTLGVTRALDGSSFPVFASKAQGCLVWDMDGKEYIDYTMGWGSTVIGYAHPRIKAALTEAIESAALLTYAQPIEFEVSRMLIEDFPSAEMVTFGKNGSDVCTLAARLSRTYTNRKTILYCGYHGWGDFWVEQYGFERSGVPERHDCLIHRFGFNDIPGFLTLFEKLKEDLACVMLEPSGPWGGNDVGCEPDADQEFLETLRKKSREAGALLVFDEIVTGYRYLEGSVQKARGISPDLTCLGKSLASGLPLSALLGRSEIFHEAFGRCYYGPTFKEESLSFAAAKASIELFREEPVASFVWDYGKKLRQGIEQVLSETGLAGSVTGPPFRMSLVLEEPDMALRLKLRTLLQQELLRAGISIFNNGVMLPCYAHDEATLDHTLSAMGKACQIAVKAQREGNLDHRIEIPLLSDM